VRVLLIEDEDDLGEVVKEGLEASRYEVVWERDGRAGLERAVEGGFSVILLDLMLPGMDGWAICRRLRDRRDPTPILMLTARDGVDDRVRGLETGADDYLPKPFDFKELRARVRALLRRERVHRAGLIRVADLTIDTDSRKATLAGRDLPLTAREYTLLEALAGHEGRILSQERILERVWGDEDSASNTVEVYVSMLRKKIDAGRDPERRLIHTVRGLGYTLRAPDGEA
jgi:DNA-binding response OmpR family regulator